MGMKIKILLADLRLRAALAWRFFVDTFKGPIQ